MRTIRPSLTIPGPRLRQRILSVVTTVLVIAALSLGILWIIPVNDYLTFPGSAQPVSSMISVGSHASGGSGNIYDTYVDQYRATHLLYVLFGLLQSDVTIQPASEVSGGCSGSTFEAELQDMMAGSKVEAEEAALHVLGYKITAAKGGPEVSQITCNVPAAKVLHGGDQIVAIDGKPTPTFKAVRDQTVRHPPGSVLHLTIRRQGKVLHVSVPTVHADRNDQIVSHGGHAMIGVIMTMPLKFPVKVHINTGNVGGPSAGLAFALGIVEQITGKDLSRGNKVAVTGTITYGPVQLANGKSVNRAVVGPIGGARQKALAAQAAGARYFLVPTENYSDAVSAHARLKVISVTTLGDALHVLHTLPSSSANAS